MDCNPKLDWIREHYAGLLESESGHTGLYYGPDDTGYAGAAHFFQGHGTLNGLALAARSEYWHLRCWWC